MSFNIPNTGDIFVPMIEIYTEDINVCPGDNGGITQRIGYAPISYIKKLVFPANNELEGRKTILRNGISLEAGKKIKFIDVFLEQNSLKEKTAGGPLKWKFTSELYLSVLGVTARNLGFIDQIKNEKLIFFVPDNNGKIWLFGTTLNPARLTNYEGDTGKKIEDDAMLGLGFTAHSELYLYEGDIHKLNQ